MDVEFLRYQFQDGFSGVITKYGFSIGVRHLQMAYMFVSAVIMGAIRGSVGIAVLAITDQSRQGDTYIQIHHWDRRMQGAIISSFFFGYAVWALPAELYLKKLNGKFVVTAMLAVNGALSVAMPTIANKPLGWELIFYCMAIMTLAMAIVYGVLTASTPDRHQAIGDKEKEFIREALMGYSKKSIPKPWKQILTSPHFWAVAGAHAASNAVFVFYLVDVPAYLKVFQLSLEDSAWFSMFPFIAMWVIYVTTAPTLGWISNLTLVSYIFDVTTFRKFINILGAVGVVIGLMVSSSLSPEWTNSAVVLLTVTLGLLGFQLSGFLSSYSDMSDNHAGTLMMLGSAFSSAVGAAVPFITGLTVGNDELNPQSWRPVLLYLASAYVLCNVAYTMLASNERQQWDRRHTRNHNGHYNGIIDVDHLQLEEFNIARRTQGKQENNTAC